MSETFTTRLQTLMRERKISDVALSDALSNESGGAVSDKSILQWRTNPKSNPTAKNIIRLADYFGVSTDYLLGLSDVATTEENIKQAAVTLNKSETAIERISYANMTDKIMASKLNIADKFLCSESFLSMIFHCTEFAQASVKLNTKGNPNIPSEYLITSNREEADRFYNNKPLLMERAGYLYDIQNDAEKIAFEILQQILNVSDKEDVSTNESTPKKPRKAKIKKAVK
jgi:transcriptional regulator with XRE-family HTH domain